MLQALNRRLLIALVVSVLSNIALGWAWLGQHDKAVVSKVEERQAVGVALQCSQGTEQLEQKAMQRQAQAAPKIAAAASSARQADERADQILSTPASVPGDDCRSAADRVDAWWKARAGR